MRTFTSLKGMPVFEINTGSKMGEVCDVALTDNGRVKGLLLKKGVVLKITTIINIQNVSSFGPDGVMIEDQSQMETVNETMDNEDAYLTGYSLIGKSLFTKEGEQLGLLEDVYFLEEVGTIVGYKCSDGFFSDILEGKRVVESDEPPAIGKDAIIVNVKKL